MIRLAIIVIFVSLTASSVLAGTWRDDFEDGNLNGWEGLDNCWAVEKGECSGEFLNAPPGISAFIWTGDAGWKDYTVTLKMKFVQAPSDRAGITFRHNDVAWELYEFLINVDSLTPGNTSVGIKYFQEIASFPSKIPLPFTLSKDIWYELKITAKGDHFEFYIDGKPAGEFTDNSIPSGKVGFIVTNTHVHFDDFIISGDDVEDGGSWDPAKHPVEKAVEPKSKLATAWGKIKSN